MSKRKLNPSEAAILALIQEGYGPQNAAENVLFNEASEATIFVKTINGTSVLMANLTNLAAWRSDGTIASDDELKSFWLRLK